MKKLGTARLVSTASFVRFASSNSRSIRDRPTGADPWPAEATDQYSGSSPSEPVPLWRRGISTWTGDGYITLPRKVGIDAPPEVPGRARESIPYTVPVDPSASQAASEGDGYPADGLDLPGIKVNPLANIVDPAPSIPSPTRMSSEFHQPSEPSVEPSTSAGVAPPINPPIVSSESAAVGTVDSSTDSAASTPPIDVVVESSSSAPTITDQVEAGVAVDQPPLYEDAIRWYQYPWRWMRTGWTNHGEIGLDGSDGNSDTLAIQTGLELKRKTDDDTFALDFDYRFVTSQDVTTEDNGRLNLDYDRLFPDSPWSLFGKFGMEWDKFKAFDLRLNLNSGVGYHWIRTDRTTFVSRFGAGASKEIGAPDDGWTPEAVFGLDGEHRINKYHKLIGKFDYFPAWDDFSDYRLVTDMGWEILLDDDNNLSLKLAATDRYDSTPQGAKPNDLYYSLLLLLKF